MSRNRIEKFEVTTDPLPSDTPMPMPTTMPTTMEMPLPTDTTMPMPTTMPTTMTMPLPTDTTMPMPTTMPTAMEMPLPTDTTMPMPTTVLRTMTMPSQSDISIPTTIPTTIPPTSPTTSPMIGVTAPPPGLSTPSVQAMGDMGFYTLGKPGNISQVGGEGPNNYFQPNIFIKRRDNGDSSSTSTTNTHRFEIGVGKELEGLLPSVQNTLNTVGGNNTQYNVDTTYGSSSGYNFSSTNPKYDPLDTATQNYNLSDLGTAASNWASNYSDYYYDGNSTIYYNDQANLEPASEPFNNHPMKRFIPGYQVQPPKCWDVPAKRPPVCLGNNERLPSAVFDRGTPLNALNLDTSVGSILPKFKYTEQPRS